MLVWLDGYGFMGSEHAVLISKAEYMEWWWTSWNGQRLFAYMDGYEKVTRFYYVKEGGFYCQEFWA